MEPKFTVYKTVNLKNNKYYFGIHKTINPNDSYLGSGKLILRAIAKYGEENFKKEVLFIFEIEQEAFAKEFELVEAAKQDKLCYNLRQGGSGGFDWINRNGVSGYHKGALRMNQKLKEKFDTDQTWRKTRLYQMKKQAETNLRPYQFKEGNTVWLGRKHSEETKKLLARKNARILLGERNGAYGRICMRHPTLKKKVRVKSSQIEELKLQGWQVGWKGWVPGE